MKEVFENSSIEKSNGYGTILMGSLISVGITMLLLVLFSTILAYTNISESSIVPVIIIISMFSTMTGSAITTHKIRSNGLVKGSMVGMAYILIIYITSSTITMDFSLNLQSIIMVIGVMIAAMLGGIIGVNR